MKKTVIMSVFTAVFLAACAPTETPTPAATIEESMIESSPTADMPTETNEEIMMDEAMNEVEVEAGSFYFAPDEIRVKQGETVKI
jgi:plastocyanin